MKKEDVYARMMHTPDDPVRAEMRSALREVRQHLLPLHRALIDLASAEYSSMVAPVAGPGHLLKLLQEDAFFAWLKPLTALIVEIDAMTSTDFERADFDAVALRTEKLFDHASDTEFTTKYVPALQRDVDVAIHHAGLRKALPRMRRSE